MMCELFMVLAAGLWVETTPQDFMDGWYDPLLYVSRRLQVEGANPADSGAVEFYARFDANRDGYYDLVSADANGPYVRLWFGSPTGYTGSNSRYFPVTYGGNCDMADLNLDGWPELIHSGYLSWSCTIYWGSQSIGGPDPNNYTSLPNAGAEAVFIYDLDRDTYLDVIVACNINDNLRVYWGGPSGYLPDEFSERNIPSYLCHNLEAVDLNKDGYTDIVITAGANPTRTYILWGDGDNRDLSDNQVWYDERGDIYYLHGLTLADLNRDGWVDIVATGYSQITTTRVYWSDNGSFSSSNITTINTNECYGGSSAWDVNGDGWLDLIFFRGQSSLTPLLCLNTRVPPYFTDNDTIRFGISAGYSGGFAYDFNRDNRMELFTNVFGDNSYVYWGVSSTGSYDSVQSLPVNYDHHGGFRECGNVYDRSPMAWYESGIFSSADLQATATISWVAWDSTQIGSELRMYIRTRQDGSSPWSSWRQVSNGETVSEAPYFPARDIQYRAEFRWQNPAWLPWLERVNLTTSSSLYESTDESSSGSGALRFGSSKSLVWVSWPGHEGQVSLYSADGRRIGSRKLANGRAEFGGLKPGVYYIKVNGSESFIRVVMVR